MMMATMSGAAKLETGLARIRSRGLSATGFDWAAAALSVWVVGGVYLDGWAHEHGRVDDTFFTPWHAVLYTGVFAMFTFLLFHQWRNMTKGHAWQAALPDGYLLSLVGAMLFMLGGVLDLVWHNLFGVEVNLEALLSPTHLLLAASGFLMVSGPLRSIWPRLLSGEPGGWHVAGPLILSLTLLLAILAFFTQFVHPFHQLYAARPSDSVGSLTIAGILIQTVLMMGVVLLALRHGRLPFGAMTAIIGVATGLQTVFHDLYVLLPAALLTGLIADLLAARLQPSETRRWQFFLFAATVPVVCYGLYFLTIQLAQGIAWTIHLWLGSIFLAGIAGLFVSFLVVSPLTRTTELANGSTQGDVSPSTRQVSQ